LAVLAYVQAHSPAVLADVYKALDGKLGREQAFGVLQVLAKNGIITVAEIAADSN
jgi:hypothetical protein